LTRSLFGFETKALVGNRLRVSLKQLNQEEGVVLAALGLYDEPEVVVVVMIAVVAVVAVVAWDGPLCASRSLE
jgi:hypothetical protein